MNKRGIDSFAQDRENCAKAAHYARQFARVLPFPAYLKEATRFLLLHAFLYPVRLVLEGKQPLPFWTLCKIFMRVMRDDFPTFYAAYREVEGEICVINGQEMRQIFQLAGAKAKGFYTFARQTHYFNSTARYHFDFVDCYEVYCPTQAKLLGEKARLLPLPPPDFNPTAQIILVASQPVRQDKAKLYAFAQYYPLRHNEQLVIRFHPKETHEEKQRWRDAMQARRCEFMESDARLDFSTLKLCVSLNSALTIEMKRHGVPTLCLVKCE